MQKVFVTTNEEGNDFITRFFQLGYSDAILHHIIHRHHHPLTLSKSKLITIRRRLGLKRRITADAFPDAAKQLRELIQQQLNHHPERSEKFHQQMVEESASRRFDLHLRLCLHLLLDRVHLLNR